MVKKLNFTIYPCRTLISEKNLVNIYELFQVYKISTEIRVCVPKQFVTEKLWRNISFSGVVGEISTVLLQPERMLNNKMLYIILTFAIGFVFMDILQSKVLIT